VSSIAEVTVGRSSLCGEPFVNRCDFNTCEFDQAIEFDGLAGPLRVSMMTEASTKSTAVTRLSPTVPSALAARRFASAG
jgi:hypothetical protein